MPETINEILTESFSTRCIEAIQRFQLHAPSTIHPEFVDFPLNKRAAVLILLFELNRDGVLRVLLTTRSKQLRSHPGQTALPGGKVDATDDDVIATSLREADEEVQLPRISPHVHVLTCLHPLLSLYRLMVTPVVAVLTDNSLLEQLAPQDSEVAHIFHHPLEALLDPELVESISSEDLAEKGGEDWPYETDWYNTSDANWLRDTKYRMHRFRTTQTPIKGLTSDILIHAAEIAFNRKTSYDRYAPQQLRYETAIEVALLELGNENPNPGHKLTTENREQLANA